MQILILGAGAVGSYVGAFLGRSGQLVTLVGRPDFVRAVGDADHGLRVQLPSGAGWHTNNFRAVESLDAAAGTRGLFGPPYDAILLCMKAYDLPGAIAQLQACEKHLCYPGDSADRQTALLCFQNGVGSEETVAQAFGAHRVWAATTTSPVSVPQVGEVRVERAHGTICLAPWGHSMDIPRNDPLARRQDLLVQTLKGAFFDLRCYQKGPALKWSKLLLNMMGNATSAILGLPPADIYGDRKLFHLEMTSLREAVRVMRALGVRPVNLPGYPARTLDTAVRVVPEAILQPVLRGQLARGRGNKWPSFYYEVANHTGKCEVTWLNGAVARLGQKVGVPAPVNQRLTDVLLSIIRGEDGAGAWRGQVAKLTNA